MKLRWKITIGIVGAGAICAAVWLRPDNTAKNALEETRRALRQQGFKIDLAEFDLSASASFQERTAALLAAHRNPVRVSPYSGEIPNLMNQVGENSALVVWDKDLKDSYLQDPYGHDVGPFLRNSLNSNQAVLDAACEAALSGPIRFNLNALAGSFMPIPHVPILQNLCQVFGVRAMLDLHDGDTDAAWTNLLASARLVSAWDVEPSGLSHLAQSSCATIAYDVIWQALQAHNWSDDRLAQLQREWEAVEFFKGLAETAAFSRVGTTALCQQERQTPAPAPVILRRGIVQSPKSIWYNFTYRHRQALYRNFGSYEDERNLLLYYRDRQLELQRAAQCRTWADMRQMPGITNPVPFQSKNQSRMRAILNQHQIALAILGQGQGLLGRAAEAEARRRLIIAAVALERYRGRHGSYPDSLEKLAPEFLKNAPTDFMDGKPLRYRLMGDGRFLLYSVGLDCVDDGGKIPQTDPEWPPLQPGVPLGGDIVWPLPASGTEAAAFTEAKKREFEDKPQAAVKTDEERAAQTEARRKATVAELMAQIQHPDGRTAKSSVREPTYNGQVLSKVIGNKAVLGNTDHSLDELLKVKQVITGGEPDMATFELPVLYDVITNIGGLRLLVDVPLKESNERPPFLGEVQLCERATNGNCLLLWNTTYDPPGQHVVRAHLHYSEGRASDTIEVPGPIVPFYSSNICQFSTFYDTFSQEGATLYARLPESNGIYTIELKSPTGDLIKTFKGATSNGVIQVEWNLIDDQGRRYTNNSFETKWDVTLPDSGRSQHVNGP